MNDIQKISEQCKSQLDLVNARLSDEYYYQSIPLCIIDAVYSIGVNYESTRQTVIRYCDYFNLPRVRGDKRELPEPDAQESIKTFLDKMLHMGVTHFTEEVFNNRQRTSATNGILKAEAVYHFASVLHRYGVNYFQDIPAVMLDESLEEEIKRIPGQKSGISLQYFFMLAGSDEYIKPDRMIIRFLEDTLQRKVGLDEANTLLSGVTKELKVLYSDITPRMLDHEIWKYVRDKV